MNRVSAGCSRSPREFHHYFLTTWNLYRLGVEGQGGLLPSGLRYAGGSGHLVGVRQAEISDSQADLAGKVLLQGFQALVAGLRPEHEPGWREGLEPELAIVHYQISSRRSPAQAESILPSHGIAGGKMDDETESSIRRAEITDGRPPDTCFVG